MASTEQCAFIGEEEGNNNIVNEWAFDLEALARRELWWSCSLYSSRNIVNEKSINNEPTPSLHYKYYINLLFLFFFLKTRKSQFSFTEGHIGNWEIKLLNLPEWNWERNEFGFLGLQRPALLKIPSGPGGKQAAQVSSDSASSSILLRL